ncbi:MULTISPECIES: hypothetical protein [Pandoraea]|uniref:hypothetical protein n=1 Tax=Pandoraea TaxID=93217 RepID=UPI001F5D5787|nr:MULTISPECIES: hypothetical protein [Pandoraea]
MDIDRAHTANARSLTPTSHETSPAETGEWAGSFESAHHLPPDNITTPHAVTTRALTLRTAHAPVTDFPSLMRAIPEETRNGMRTALASVCARHIEYENVTSEEPVLQMYWKEFTDAVRRCEAYWATVQKEYFPQWAMFFVICGFANTYLSPNHKQTMTRIYAKGGGYAFSEAAYDGERIAGWSTQK